LMRCVLVLIYEMVTLNAVYIATACIVSACYGVPLLFHNDSQLAVNVDVASASLYDILLDLQHLHKDAGSNRIYTFNENGAMTSWFLVSLLCDVLLVMDIQNWPDRPAVTWASGLITKIKALVMMSCLCWFGTFRMIHRMTPSFVTWNVASDIFNVSWHTVANPIMCFVFNVA